MTDPTRLARLIPLCMTAILISLFTLSCETLPWYRTVPEVEATPQPEVPPSFLYTDFEPLNNWLEERFQVEYRNMTPSLIFDQQPIDSIHYEKVNLPPNSYIFELKSPNISRREILYKMSQRWDLTMSIEEEDGLPKIVRVVGKGDQITEEAKLPEGSELDVPGRPIF